jgi:hypothetical protein
VFKQEFFRIKCKNKMDQYKTYQQQKMDFLDNLQPDDLRNGESFNQMGAILDNINEAFYNAKINNKNPEEFINKSLTNLFRENSQAIASAKNLAQIYSQTK